MLDALYGRHPQPGRAHSNQCSRGGCHIVVAHTRTCTTVGAHRTPVQLCHLVTVASRVQASTEQLTSNSGAPVGSNTDSVTVGARGPVLLEDFRLIEKISQFDREKIPERIVHARGAAAFGEFEVTGDISKYTDAKVRIAKSLLHAIMRL